MSRLLTEAETLRFERVLIDYQPNNEVLDLFKASNFGVIAGPAGTGKDTLRDGLIDRYPDNYLPILSTTTRPPRVGETDGQTYHFREIGQVKEGLEKREFFQAALVHGQQISCLHVDEIRKLREGQCGLSILIPSTEKELLEIKPDIMTIFLIPPSAKILMQRMQAERKLSQDELSRRVLAARKEIQQALEMGEYYCLLSETIPEMIEKTHRFLQTKDRDLTEDRKSRQIMKQVLSGLWY
jgi:guanylate kinase